MNGTRGCSVSGCESGYYSKGLCKKHYCRVKRTGDAGPAGPRLAKKNNVCSVSKCMNFVGEKGARGYCTKHYQMLLKAGDPCGTTAPSAEERFFEKVDASGNCWQWLAGKDESGYGMFSDEVTVRAHRWAYAFLVAPIPEGKEIDHLCRNRSCVNPDHLEPVQPIENWRRGFSLQSINSKKTHCKNGHPFDEMNTYRRPDGSRCCRACTAISRRKYQTRKAA